MPTVPSQRLTSGSRHLTFSQTAPSLQKGSGILGQSVQAEQTASAKGREQGGWKERGVPGEQTAASVAAQGVGRADGAAAEKPATDTLRSWQEVRILILHKVQSTGEF